MTRDYNWLCDVRGEDEGPARDAARNKDVSSLDASSSKLFSQDFGSDDCVASADGHVHNNEEQPHCSDSVSYGGQGGGFDEVDDATLVEAKQPL